MNILSKRLQEKEILISDGAWGTELSKLGMAAGIAPESWNYEKPEQVLAVATSYVEAGADIILTNSFGGTRFKLERNGIADQLEKANRTATEISKRAAVEQTLVFASLGPTGEFMEPLGTLSEKEVVAAFAEQVKALLTGKPDGLVIETMTDLGEAQAALRACREVCDLPVVVCMTYDKGAAGYATIMGIKPQQAAEELTRAGATAVGANCGAGIENMIEIVGLLRAGTDLPLWAKANAGLPELENGQTVFRQGPADFAAGAEELRAAGASIIGGCCGTTPEHIKALCSALR
jgi:5-methyltetrahydrofolate--homocysteine methyltransferase